MFVKGQCMHCNQPACASACLTKALLKTEEGPVIWRASKCMGCRMCMVSCPFGVPKFEYDSANPKIVKCDLCWERLEAGGKPACVEACPAGALTFGTRRELLRTARERIHREPDRYVDHIYGEHEAGGTGVLYLASVPFEQLAMDTTLGDVPYPELAKPFLSSVPVVLILFPALMLALARSRAEQVAEREEPR
jgi:Fe-S-cluster-containing dehydrogenase component